MYFVEGYVSSPELLDRLWRETMSNLHGPERTNEVAFELANEKLANFLFACP
ncbi:hypothetical protein PhaeoP88_00519 [Phaeobacter inhibens]|uniref:Uncharacterized protein n=1 Tax=Phaeobacter inhibens TaxID=221822 RepID=A0A2I7K5N9_9RHOB|nr:hypothetical protein PhaeoP88_00519 [Phaeobacter inhibens]